MLAVRNPSGVRLIEGVHQSIWVHVQKSAEIILFSVLEAALPEEFNSSVFIPNDYSGEAGGHGLDVVLGPVRSLPATCRLFPRGFELELVEFFLLILIEALSKDPHVYKFLSLGLLAKGYVLKNVELLEL